MYPGGGAAAWSPLELAADGLFWFRSDLDCSGALWVDQFPGGYDFAQSTGSKQPTYNASSATFNGRPSLSFSSMALQTMSTPDIAYGVAELFLVCKIQGGGRLYNHHPSVAHAIYMVASVQGFHGDAAGSYQFVGASTLYDPASGRRIIGHRTGGTIADHLVLVDGTDITDAVVRDDGPISAEPSAPFWLASYQDSAEFADVEIAEVLGVRRVLTAPERSAFATYAAGLYT